MFDEILKNPNLTKKQTKTVNTLIKQFSEKSAKDLSKANSLLFDFYISEKSEAMNICLDVLTNIKFNGNFELWSEIEPSVCLKYYLSNNEDEKTK